MKEEGKKIEKEVEKVKEEVKKLEEEEQMKSQAHAHTEKWK